jgi:hypothetical protein
MICKYHPLTSKAYRLDVQPPKRSLSGILLLAVANHFAPTKTKIKGKNWICVDIVLVQRPTDRSMVIRLQGMNELHSI